MIVEGANLFITPAARERLSERGAVIIKDSSANKAGVICSSYEIIASMLLDQATFLDIKDRYVAEVLDKLRAFARLEADVLLREHRHKPAEHLPALSVRLSRAINHATDAVVDGIDALRRNHPELVRDLLLAHLPPVLAQRCGERVMQSMPAAYLHRVIASALASRMVYREGLDWLESMPAPDIARLAESYLVREAQVQRLVDQVRASDLDNRETIADLLETGGVAAALKTSA